MAFVTITDTDGVDHLVHTSQIGSRYPAPAADAWREVWAKFKDRPDADTTGPSAVPGGPLNPAPKDNPNDQ